ncbi:MAG: tyrosine-type recombinase/integrase [Bdellovibrionaceae bacterium]|nr:tyrosine-type recombinase/integrase [Pseudobdellovibrionaceae bacterium]
MNTLQVIESKIKMTTPVTDRQQFEDLLQAFLSGRSQKTIEAYRQDIKDFQHFIAVETPEAAAAQLLSRTLGEANGLILKYKTNLMDRKFQPATINRRLAAIRSLTKMARMLGMIPWSLEIENAKSQPYRDTRGPGRTAFQQMLRAAGNQRNHLKAIRDKTILRVFYDLALRTSELAQLDVCDLDLKAGTISVLGKGQTEKIILSLPQPTQKSLGLWLEVRGTRSGPLFTNLDRAKKGSGRIHRSNLFRMVQGLGEQVGIKTRTHALRHLSITEACKAAHSNGIAVEEVMDFSRHKNIKTLMVYRDRERNIQGKLAELVAQCSLESDS